MLTLQVGPKPTATACRGTGRRVGRRRRTRCTAVRSNTPLSDTGSTSGHGGSGKGRASPSPVASSRRAALQAGAALLLSAPLSLPAKASYAPAAVDRAWEAFGGGPGDLYFPEVFLGEWTVNSTLVSLETPLGEDFVPNMKVVQRAKQEDLNNTISYASMFVMNSDGKVVFDRKYNTVALLKFYMGDSMSLDDRISWDINNPNDIRISLPGGTVIESRTTRRSQITYEAESRTETSEFLRQMYDTSESSTNKVKASQCFTKYKWRSREAANGGPVIVATQVVSDYLTPSDGEEKMIQAMNKPVVIYTYKMSFFPVDAPIGNAS